MTTNETTPPALDTYLVVDDGHRVTAPRRHFALVSAVLADEDISAGQSTLITDDDTTTWSTWLTTKTTVIHAVAEFAAPFYTAGDDFDARPPEMKIIRAWTRPLSSVVSVDVQAIGRSTQAWFPISSATVTFSDGITVDLPTQDRLSETDRREHSDRLYREIRRGPRP